MNAFSWRKLLAPHRGALSFFGLTGGLRFASTPGYFLSTLRVEDRLPSVATKPGTPRVPDGRKLQALANVLHYVLVLLFLSIALSSARAQTTRTWVGPDFGDWFTPNNWSPSGVPATNDILFITNAADIYLNAPVVISGTLTWAGGYFYQDSLTVASNGVLNITGSGNQGSTIEGTLINQGTVNWQGGGLGAGTILNEPGALFYIECDSQISGSAQFVNTGTIQKLDPGTTLFSMPLANATGSVIVSQGILDLNAEGPMDGFYNAAYGTSVQFSGTLTYTSVPVLIGTGAFQVTGGSLTLANNIIPNLQMLACTVLLGTNFQGGTITNLTIPYGLYLSGNYVISGTLNMAGQLSAGSLQIAAGGVLNWTGAPTFYGPLTIASSGTLNIVGGGYTAPLTNYGTVKRQF